MSSALRPFARLAALRFGTLSTRIAVLYAGLFALVLGVVVSLAAGGLSRFGEASAARDLAANARVFDEILAARARQMGDQAGVLARPSASLPPRRAEPAWPGSAATSPWPP